MESRVLVNGINVHYVIEGPDDAPVVTFSHALGANLHVWDAQATGCSRRYRVLRYDTRGHGDTDAPNGPYTLEILADDAAALLDALAISKTRFVGLSMGGMIGQALALEHPEVLDALVLCDTTSGRGELDQATWDANWKQRIDAVLDTGLDPHVPETIDRWFSPEFIAARGDIVEPVRTMIRSTSLTGYIGCCHAISRLEFTERLPQVTVPTLVLVGEDDPGTPVAAARAIHERISGSQMVIIPGARHLANVEQAEYFNEALLTFLDAH